MSFSELSQPVNLKLVVSTPDARTPLPVDRLERVESWGMNASVLAYVYRPSAISELREVFETAKRHGVKVALRGGGRSYGDAAMCGEQILLELTRLNRILEWNPKSGLIKVEPGVTLRALWQYIIGDGWWPPVVSGTMFVTIGGAVGMNYHGKNNYKMGTIGDHVLEFDILLPTGTLLTCSREQNRDIFFSAIGGFGMLGCFTSITLQMKKVYSGLLKVNAFPVRNFKHIFEEYEVRRRHADYLVGWIDCFAKGDAIGRGEVHDAYYLPKGEDPNPAQTLRVENQELPDTILGVFPKSLMWRLMKPFSNDLGMRLLNLAKFTASSIGGHEKSIKQSHAGFAFLLDYVPNWKFVYKPGGLIQYQSFIPVETAEACFTKQIETCQEWGIVPYLGVFKRHRKDEFLMTHSLEGYSFALDFPVTKRNRERLWKLCDRLNEIVLEAGGRFYFAKDSALDSATVESYLGKETIEKFAALKNQCDPDHLLQTDLSKRLFGNWEVE